VIDAVAECGRAGVKVATILAAGFSETGADGVAREQRLREVAAENRHPAWSAPPASAWSTCATGCCSPPTRRLPNRIFGRAHLLCLALRHHDRRTDVRAAKHAA